MAYTWEGMKKVNFKEALRYYNKVGLDVYKLYDDDTEACADNLEDITDHFADNETENFGVQYDDIALAEKNCFMAFAKNIIYEQEYKKTGSGDVLEKLKKEYNISDKDFLDFASKIKETYDTFIKLTELRF